MMKAKILLLDIETAPNLVYTWGLWKQNVALNQIVQTGYMLSWAAKWIGKKEIMSDSLRDNRSKRLDLHDDSSITKSIWKLLDEADIVIAHNGDQFDIKWLNGLFLKHKLKPVSPFKSIDTLRVVKENFRFISNKLDYICSLIRIGNKLKHEGFSLWTGCMSGDKKCWKKMIRYNKHDVVLLEKVYHQIKPFIKWHPNVTQYEDDGKLACPVCGSVKKEARGFAFTANGGYQRFVCKDCGKWYKSPKRLSTTSSRNIY